MKGQRADARSGENGRLKRAISAVAVSAAVAVAVAVPAALNVLDDDPAETPTSNTDPSTDSSTEAPSSTIPVQVLGTSETTEPTKSVDEP